MAISDIMGLTPECNGCTKLEKLIEDGWKVLILCDNCGKLHTNDASLRDLIED